MMFAECTCVWIFLRLMGDFIIDNADNSNFASRVLFAPLILQRVSRVVLLVLDTPQSKTTITSEDSYAVLCCLMGE